MQTNSRVIPTGIYPHMPIPPRLHIQRWLTKCSVITEEFDTPGRRLSNALSPCGC